MKKGNKKDKNDRIITTIVLVTSILNLIHAVIDIIIRLME